jgi:hypothetical protein
VLYADAGGGGSNASTVQWRAVRRADRQGRRWQRGRVAVGVSWWVSGPWPGWSRGWCWCRCRCWCRSRGGPGLQQQWAVVCVAALLRLQRMTRAQTCRGGMSGMRLGVCGTGEGEQRGEESQGSRCSTRRWSRRREARDGRTDRRGLGLGLEMGLEMGLERADAADRQPMGDSRSLVSAARAAVSTGTKAPSAARDTRRRVLAAGAGAGSGSLALPRSCCNVGYRPCAAPCCAVRCCAAIIHLCSLHFQAWPSPSPLLPAPNA